MTNPEGPYVKVHFRLEVEGDWPPASVESLWAVDQGDGTVRLDNIPGSFEASRARTSWLPSPTKKACTGPAKWFGVRRTAPRFIVFRDSGSGAARQSVINAFREVGVDGEGIEQFGMVGLDVPPTADFAKVQRLLKHGVAKEWWDMEEGCITAQWRATSVS